MPEHSQRDVGRALAPEGRVLVTDFGTAGLRFPGGWATRGFTVVAEVLSGPTHAGNGLAYLRAEGLGPIVAEAGLRGVDLAPCRATSASMLTRGGPTLSPAHPAICSPGFQWGLYATRATVDVLMGLFVQTAAQVNA